MKNKLVTLELIKECVDYCSTQSADGATLGEITAEDYVDMFEMIETLKGFFNATSHK